MLKKDDVGTYGFDSEFVSATLIHLNSPKQIKIWFSFPQRSLYLNDYPHGPFGRLIQISSIFGSTLVADFYHLPVMDPTLRRFLESPCFTKLLFDIGNDGLVLRNTFNITLRGFGDIKPL